MNTDASDPPVKSAPPAKAPPLTATAIARQLGRAPNSVIEAIARLGLAPEIETPGVRLYPATSIDAVRAAMRAPNRRPRAGRQPGGDR